jgi:hypothetical protein
VSGHRHAITDMTVTKRIPLNALLRDICACTIGAPLLPHALFVDALDEALPICEWPKTTL